MITNWLYYWKVVGVGTTNIGTRRQSRIEGSHDDAG
jgi:hypothetical protein